MFGRDTVQNHTQCITEAEKYGPKGQGKALNGSAAKSGKDKKQRPEVDINVGLSNCPPWFCSCCNTRATSQQALLLHAEGKKHGAKAQAFHASQQPSVQAEKHAPDAKDAVEAASDGVAKKDGINAEHPKLQEPSEENNLKPASEVSSEKKKRKLDATKGGLIKKCKIDASVDTKNDEVILGEKTKDRKIKWKKFIKAALKSHPGGLKMKKMRKVVFKALQESGIVVNENELSDTLDQNISSSSKLQLKRSLFD
ncbi:UBP1-associated proteins 1C-like [Vicia villosa]|uniref:UBP1-associated proteins 1C-like n=1 Tax=Vicia villosa TaxID=3911 RepID=UPI00273B1ECF|nr:UBP1-associated proteins 1C-like [Vicia villosa]